MDSKLLEKAYNCYLAFLDRLNYGNVNQDYRYLYSAAVLLKNNITDPKYTDCIESNLTCPVKYKLGITVKAKHIIEWTLNASGSLLPTFTWNEINAPVNGLYPFYTNPLVGFNFLYITIPIESNFRIYNELDMVLFDSLKYEDAPNQVFHYIGTHTTSYGQTNKVYRKDDVYNTYNSVGFKVELF